MIPETKDCDLLKINLEVFTVLRTTSVYLFVVGLGGLAKAKGRQDRPLRSVPRKHPQTKINILIHCESPP
ncbi:hypothetical protein BH10BAC4_BH10BAC4_04720 [soil metagenome]